MLVDLRVFIFENVSFFLYKEVCRFLGIYPTRDNERVSIDTYGVLFTQKTLPLWLLKSCEAAVSSPESLMQDCKAHICNCPLYLSFNDPSPTPHAGPPERAGLKLVILLHQLPECWESKCDLLCPASLFWGSLSTRVIMTVILTGLRVTRNTLEKRDTLCRHPFSVRARE